MVVAVYGGGMSGSFVTNRLITLKKITSCFAQLNEAIHKSKCGLYYFEESYIFCFMSCTEIYNSQKAITPTSSSPFSVLIMSRK